MKKRNWKSIIAKFVLISFIVPIAYSIYKIIVAPVSNTGNIEGLRVKADYALILVQCALGILGFFLPNIISKRAKIVIPSSIYMFYILFLYASLFLGEVRHFYYKIPNWDTILHTCSGVMLGALGFSFVNILNKNKKIRVQLSPAFVVLFTFCFAISLGVMWEICEFTIDGLFGVNMQKFALEDGTGLIGRAAVVDTMEDLIVDSIGAFVMTIIRIHIYKIQKGMDREIRNT